MCYWSILITPTHSWCYRFRSANFEADTDFSMMRELSSAWTAKYDQGGGMSAAPIYLGVMALAGVYLIKDSIHYLFVKIEDKK